MKNRTLLLASLLLAFLLHGCGDDAATDPTPNRTYKIGMVHWAGFSPLNVADAKGFWEEQGIDVEIVNNTANTDLYAQLDNKQIDIALDMIGSWVDLRLQGKPYTIIGETDWSNGGDKIIIKQGKTLAELKGGKIGAYLNMLSVRYFINKYLTANGAQLADFNVTQVGNPDSLADRFISGEFELSANYDPYAARAVAEGNGTVAATSADYQGCIPEGFVARTDVLAGIPEADLIKIFKGWIKAVKWAADPANWNEYKQILITRTFPGDNVTTDDELRAFLAAVKIHSQAEQLEANRENGDVYRFLTDLNTFAKANGFPSADFTPKEIFDNTAIVKALQQ